MEKQSSTNVYIVSACRTAIGEFGGGFKTVRAAVKRVGIEKSRVDEIVWGECHQQLDQCNTARVMAMKAGFPKEVPSFTVNKVCTSSMRAIICGAQAILLGDADVVLAGGVESMSSAPYALRSARWGQRLQHGVMSDTVWEGFTCSISGYLMGITAENLAEKYNISREEQDEVALRSQKNACKAIEEGNSRRKSFPFPSVRGKARPKLSILMSIRARI
jgi:acetyl-CoA C-acetyltransferase